jgi:hypothetical protein
MTTGTPQAFVFQNGPPMPNGNSQTTFLVCVAFFVGDGSAPPSALGIQWVYDTTQGAACNIASLKAAIVAASAPFFPTLTSADVTLLLAVS